MLQYYNNILRSVLISKTYILNWFDIPKLKQVILKTAIFNEKKQLNVQIFWILYVLTGQKPVVFSFEVQNVYLVSLSKNQAFKFLQFLTVYVFVRLDNKKFLQLNTDQILILKMPYSVFFELVFFEKYFDNGDVFLEELPFQVNFVFNRSNVRFQRLLIQMLQIPIHLNDFKRD